MKYIALVAFVALMTACSIQKGLHEKPAPVSRTKSSTQHYHDAQNLSTVIKLLQKGKESRAKIVLEKLLVKQPQNSVFIDLMKQIELTPQRYFKHKSTKRYTIKSGDSLAKIAKTQLHNEMAFYALAKLNAISNASLIRVGQKIILPVVSQTAEPASQHPSKSVNAQSKRKEEQDKNTLSQSTIETMYALYKKQQLSSLLKEYLKWHGELMRVESKEAKVREMKYWLFDQTHGEAVSLFRQQELEAAIQLWDQLLTIDNQYEPALVYRQRAKNLLKKLEEIN